MTRRHLIQVLATASCAFLLGASSASAADRENERTLRVGETLQYDRGLKITFLAVRNDSRCPIDAQCLWAGDAEVVLRVKAGNQEPRKVILHTNLKPRVVVIPAKVFPEGMAGIPKSYVIGPAILKPLPSTEKKLLQSDYRLKLNISVAQ
ncbi:MAG: hypothetical protein V4819_07355 [Verrucomicrobiota bacterium]